MLRSRQQRSTGADSIRGIHGRQRFSHAIVARHRGDNVYFFRRSPTIRRRSIWMKILPHADRVRSAHRQQLLSPGLWSGSRGRHHPDHRRQLRVTRCAFPVPSFMGDTLRIETEVHESEPAEPPNTASSYFIHRAFNQRAPKSPAASAPPDAAQTRLDLRSTLFVAGRQQRKLARPTAGADASS